MCGIVGVVTKKEKLSRARIENMANIIFRRGPDSQGFFLRKNIALGHRRLSIIDLTTGEQPMFSNDESIVLVFNGEIYNFLELRTILKKKGWEFNTKSDTEVLIIGYQEYGLKNLLEKIEGMYAFALYDIKKQKLFLVRDKFGEKPLYYYHDEFSFLFASELKAIEKEIPSRSICKKGLNFFLSLTYIPAPYTIYESVYKLEQGHYLEIDNNLNVEKTRFYNLQERLLNQPKITDFEEAKSTINDLLRKAVKKQMISDVPIGSFLSGGIDSSIVTTLMAEYSNEKINTFSIGFNEKAYDETNRAQIIVDRVQSNHHSISINSNDLLNVVDDVISYYDEPYGDSSAISAYFLAKMTSEKVKVVLTGDCADELFGGYEKYLASYYVKKYNTIPNVFKKTIEKAIKALPFNSWTNVIQRKAQKVINNAHLNDFDLYYSLLSLGFQDIERQLVLNEEMYVDIQAPIKSIYNNYETDHSLEKSLFTDLSVLLEGDMLTKVDRICMRHSIEGRVPFLDSSLVETAFRLPSEFKIKGRNKKYILKEAFRDILDPRTLNFRKKGFGSPVDIWFKNNLQKELKTVLNKELIIKQNIFNYQVVDVLLKEHLGGKRNHKSKLWNLYVFQKWYFNKFYAT